MTITIRKPFIKLTKKPVVDCTGDEVLVEQHHKQETDINLIVRKYQRTGMLEHTRNSMGEFLHLNSVDFHDAMNVIAEANSAFEELSADIRRKFKNDPSNYLDFVSDPKNIDEMKELGMLHPDYQPATKVASDTNVSPKEPAPTGADPDPSGS